MKNLDEHISKALASDPNTAFPPDDPSAIGELLTTFQGRQRWLMFCALILSLGMFALSVWAGFHFVQAEALQSQLSWGGLSLLGLLMVSFIKVYFWMEMHSQRILRELKRTELRLLHRIDSLERKG
jgi:hypothetical protein